jgi:hypothetical protein
LNSALALIRMKPQRARMPAFLRRAMPLSWKRHSALGPRSGQRAYTGPTQPPFADEKFLLLMNDPMWRIRNLYWIKDKDGRAVRFVPWPEQEKFLKNLWYRNIIPKARQRGFSTVVQIYFLDCCLFQNNVSAAIIAQDETIALKIFEDKIKFAYDRLPQQLKDGNPVITDNKHELKWANGSAMWVSISPRGTTLQYLHVSEYGKIAAKFPERAKEIQSGALQTVGPNGVIVIESTVETPDDDFSAMVKIAKQDADLGRPLSRMQYRLHFASWWDADEYEEDPDLITVSPKDHAYFDRIEAIIQRKIGPRKRAWYVGKRKADFADDDEKMWTQYPSTLEEAFQVSSDGRWLSKQMAAARTQGRITTVPYDPALPVDTYWDLGDDDTVIWFGQTLGPHRTHWINYIEGGGEGYAYFVREMNATDYTFGTCYLPHDGDQRRPGAELLKTPRDMLSDLGVRNIEIVPRIADVVTGIDQLRDAMSSYWFDAEKCAEGIKHLDGYSKQWNAKMGHWIGFPKKDGHDHGADGIRQHAQMRFNLRDNGSTGRVKRRSTSGRTA